VLGSRGLVARQFSDEAANSGCVQRDGDAVGRDFDALDQEPQDARLLGRVELIPDRLKRAEGLYDLEFLKLDATSRTVRPPGAPG
jgi:hypothetical protein